MQLARSNNTPAALVRRALRRAAEALAGGGSPEPALRSRLAGLSIELEAFEQLELASIDAGAASSMLKLVGSELHQRIGEITLEIAGPDAAEAGAPAMARYLAVRAASIYSGTSETQRNLLARQMLAD
jgi:acyl-CoA dehydrogenase